MDNKSIEQLESKIKTYRRILHRLRNDIHRLNLELTKSTITPGEEIKTLRLQKELRSRERIIESVIHKLALTTDWLQCKHRVSNRLK